jgi:hypothetical protein
MCANPPLEKVEPNILEKVPRKHLMNVEPNILEKVPRKHLMNVEPNIFGTIFLKGSFGSTFSKGGNIIL